jgi:hypothetical protein
MRPLLCAACAFIASLLSACSTTSVGLRYATSTPPPLASPSVPSVAVGAFVDQRGESSTWLGAIRGGYGNVIKKLESERPVAELVRTAFAEGLRARGIPVDDAIAQTHVTGIIKKLDCSQYVRREAHVDIEITVLDKSGQRRFTHRYTADNVDGSLLSLKVGVFASVDDLRVIMEKTLREAVDQALDDSTLRAALRNEGTAVASQSSEIAPPSSPNDTSAADAQLRNAEQEFRAGRMSLEEFREIKKVLRGE